MSATVMPGYNDRKTGRGNAFADGRENGAYYVRSWQAAIGSAPDWVIVTSFNEWPEGTYIEPSQAYGNLFLDLTAQWSAGLPGLGPTAAAPGSEAESCGAGQTQTQTGCGETYIDTEANADAYSDTRAGFYPAGGLSGK